LLLPTAMHLVALGQDIESSPSPTGTDPAALQDVPFHASVVVWSFGTGNPIGRAPTVTHIAALAQERLSTSTRRPRADCHDVPFQVLAPDANPASMQNVDVGQEMLL